MHTATTHQNVMFYSTHYKQPWQMPSGTEKKKGYSNA